MEKFDRSLINKCLATILADRRTERVIGRIKFLIISIVTIKFIRAIGVSIGVRCIIMCLKFFTHPYTMIEVQNRSEIGKEIDTWAVGVKFIGIRAMIFKITIKMNR